jgi:hypothetical protein
MRPPTKQGKGSLPFDRRLAAYAAGAGALLAVAESAEATVQYSGAENITIGVGQSYTLDFTGDGSATFDFTQATGSTGATGTSSELYVYPVSSIPGPNECDDGVATFTTPGQPLDYGTDIPSQSFNTFFNSTLATISSSEMGSGPFYGVSDQYLGVEFLPTSGIEDYGWIELSVSGGTDPTAGPTATIEGWAYDDAGGDIFAGQTYTGEVPEPSALGLLALGACGVVLLRRPRKAISMPFH